MAEWLHNAQAQHVPRMLELVGANCIVKFKDDEGHGVIEEIATLVIGNDLEESINRSQFKVHLQSGDTITAPGSSLSRIDYPKNASE